MALKNKIIAEAKRLGFNLVGVTRPDPPPHVNIYEYWLDLGRHGELGYLSIDRARAHRADPSLILPDCISILSLGIDHAIPALSELIQGKDFHQEHNLRGQIASYAWGNDYHKEIPARLQKLVEFIEAHVGKPIPNRLYTDTGPILERDLAQRAGLGWIGKNTCLINPSRGSFFLLAEIFLGVDLEPDSPFSPDRCGICTRCLEACPTGCILPDRTIDASQCISYLTIELKGTIPADLRSQMGNWIFGCDICQQVCPWNQRFADTKGDKGLSGNAQFGYPQLIDELSLSPNQFNNKFKGSPIKRAKRRGYLRNVAVALGNSKSTIAVPGLLNSLRTELEPLVRGHAAWALGQIGNDQAQKALREASNNEDDPYVLEEILAAAGK